MKYDFTTCRDRSDAGSSKWNGMYQKKPTAAKGIIPFSTADMEFINPPEILDAMKAYLDTHSLGYTEPKKEYFDSVCKWMLEIHGWKIDPEDIVITPGVVPALFFCVRMLTNPGDGIIVMPPVYAPFFNAGEKAGCTCALCPLLETETGYDIDFSLLEELCKEPKNKVLLFCNPHNPVGRVWTKDELYRASKLCAENHVVLVSDEIHADITLPGHKHIPMGSLTEFADNLIVCTAPSKTFNIATMQTSNIMIKNPELRNLLITYKEDYCVESMNALGFVSCIAAYNECRDWRDEMLTVIDENYRYVKSFLRTRLPKIKMPELMGTYLVWLDCRALGLTATELDALMSEHDLFLNSGSLFGAEGCGFLRMNLACPIAYLLEALERFEAALLSVK